MTVLYGQFVLRLCQRNDLSLALDVADELYRFGEAQNDDAIRLFALEALVMTHIWRGEFVAGCDVLKNALRWMLVRIETSSAPWLPRIPM